MNFCNKCETKSNDENTNKKKIVVSKIFAWISIVLASMPLLLVIYIFIEAKTSNDTSGLIAPILVYC